MLRRLHYSTSFWRRSRKSRKKSLSLKRSSTWVPLCSFDCCSRLTNETNRECNRTTSRFVRKRVLHDRNQTKRKHLKPRIDRRTMYCPLSRSSRIKDDCLDSTFVLSPSCDRQFELISILNDRGDLEISDESTTSTTSPSPPPADRLTISSSTR